MNLCFWNKKPVPEVVVPEKPTDDIPSFLWRVEETTEVTYCQGVKLSYSVINPANESFYEFERNRYWRHSRDMTGQKQPTPPERYPFADKIMAIQKCDHLNKNLVISTTKKYIHP